MPNGALNDIRELRFARFMERQVECWQCMCKTIKRNYIRLVNPPRKTSFLLTAVANKLNNDAHVVYPLVGRTCITGRRMRKALERPIFVGHFFNDLLTL